MSRRGRRWLKDKKKELKNKLTKATKSEKVEILKTHLDNVYDSYTNFIALIPDIEKRLEELKGESGNNELIRLWGNVLNDLRNLKDRPKAMKLYYAKRVTSQIKKLRSKYPDE